MFFCLQVDIDEEKLLGRQLERGAPVQAIQVEWGVSTLTFINCFYQTQVRQPIAVSDISIYIYLIDIRDGSSKPVYGGVDRLQALSSAKIGCRLCFFMN